MMVRTKSAITKKIRHKDNMGIRFLYNTLPGRIMLKAFVRPSVSAIFGFFMDSRPSNLLVGKFVKRNNIDMGEYENEKYRSFNDFFTRKVKDGLRPFPDNARDLAAACDARLTAYPITADGLFRIKNSEYDVAALLKDKSLADEYTGGVCLIFRLTPDDYHRYSYIDDGEILSTKKIKGVLHTVRPISQRRYKIYAQNAREYTVMLTENFGKVIQVEVGALFVGRIRNHAAGGAFKRGTEKGMFEFGGSTIVMLFQKDRAAINETIYENTRIDKETIVKMGSKIGAVFEPRSV